MIAFLIKAVVVSLSGVMAPGAVTSATLACGTRNRHAGLLIALGHGIVEFPLMGLIVAGMGFVFKYPAAQILIGLVGGGFLVHMGVQLLLSLRNLEAAGAKSDDRHPVTIGVILTAGNPYFLMWWATVGLNLSMEARSLGPVAFVIFALLHWLCDAVWLEILSYASFKGTTVFGPRSQRIVLAVCSAAMIGFGAWFIVDAGRTLLKLG